MFVSPGVLLLLVGVAFGVSIPRACEPPHDKYLFCNPNKTLDERLDDLIGNLTLEEKPYLLIARESPDGNISRLGIPEYDWGGNCIHGVQSRCAPDGRCPTSFPDPNVLGATFNRTVWSEMGSVIGVELRSLWLQNVGENHDSNLPHIGLDCWSPNVGIVRDPRWGRNMETPSEDPLICGEFGAAYSLGMQNGSDPRFYQGVTTLKHYDANSLEGCWGQDCNITRHTVDANITLYDLFSTYLPAFKKSIQEGGALGVMCSYNAINGVPSCANPWLLGLLRDWGFTGYVTSDSGAVADVLNSHHYASDWPHTVAATVLAGCDIESASWPKDHPWATGGPYIQYLPGAVKAGLLKESDIDLALRHTLGLRFRMGLFDPIEDQPYWHVPPTEVRSDAHVQLALDATRQGLVLLKNDPAVAHHVPTLPLPRGKSIAVIGPHYNAQGAMLGNYLGQICFNGSAFGCVQTPLEGITEANKGGVTVGVEGCQINNTNTSGFDEAQKAAAAADYVILMLGLDGSIEGEGKDRHDIGLPETQLELARMIIQLGKPTVVVVMHGGVVALDELSVSAPAIVSIGYPGFYGAQALAESLFGDQNRWGKSPVTWYPNTFTELFDMLSFDMGAGLGRTYRYFDGEPLWPFGFGLSYTTFNLSAASDIYKQLGGPGTAETVNFAVDVANSGPVDGDEVVQVYVSAQPGVIPASAPAARLRKTLVDFARVSVASNHSTTLKFQLPVSSFEVTGAGGEPEAFPGLYDVVVTNGVTKNPVKFTCSVFEGKSGC
mmetsp:Transcript_19050/g.44658  ORF Transcript_19050/g.44658 Transcript_19050/m.44658 type:complete len:775 (-) Transcript_19050:48-2372(-)